MSDADALIESLEQLIAKKRLIKQGAMQELLTGKRRLPGFSGEWEVKTIGEIAVDIQQRIATSQTKPTIRTATAMLVHHSDITGREAFNDLVRLSGQSRSVERQLNELQSIRRRWDIVL